MNKKNQAASRREFLKTTASSIAAVGSMSVMKSGYAAGRDVIRVGLIGCGNRGPSAAEDAMMADEGVQLVAMADVFMDRVRGKRDDLKGKFPEQVRVDDDHCFDGFDGYRKVIECSDVVLIACASTYHPQYAEAAIHANKHVFVEKPHGIDPPDVRRMKAVCELAKQKKLCLVSGLMNRFIPGVQETMKRIHDGAIGDIVAIEENFLRAPYVLRGREPGDSEIAYQFRNFYHFSWLSGDDVTQSLVHNLDKALWAMKGQTPARAHGLGGRSASFGEIYGDVFDHHSVVYEYENGVKIYAFCRTQHDCHGGVSDVIMGTKGRCDLLKNRITGETNWQYEGEYGSGFKIEHQELFKAIRSGTPMVSDYMIDSTQIAVMGQMACYSGKQLTWEQAANSNFTFGPKDGSFATPPPKYPDANGNYPVAEPGRVKGI
jgi:myo-inositol 2-dehydrogenase / D-chiro-inositol 1-dehydrogenase